MEKRDIISFVHLLKLDKIMPISLYRQCIKIYIEFRTWWRTHCLPIVMILFGSRGMKRAGWVLLKSQKPAVFYGEWVNEYALLKRDIGIDASGRMYTSFVNIYGDKENLFFPKEFSIKQCQDLYRSLMLEQDYRSPHCYIDRRLKKEFSTHNVMGSILDIGCAEGNFSLMLGGRSSHLYCFEPDEQYCESLALSLKPYRNKVTIIKKMVSDEEDSDTVTIDGYFGDDIPEDISVVKMDVEGFEQRVLKGMLTTIKKNPQAILLICAYHSAEAEKEIRDILEPMGYKITPRHGYMFFYYDRFFPWPYLRRGVLEARICRG